MKGATRKTKKNVRSFAFQKGENQFDRKKKRTSKTKGAAIRVRARGPIRRGGTQSCLKELLRETQGKDSGDRE